MDRQARIDDNDARRDLIRISSGSVAYWPDGTRGYLTAQDLRALATRLDELNNSGNNSTPAR